ncbi:MAG: glutathione S-transferase family protein [Paracoccaceae bacterium]
MTAPAAAITLYGNLRSRAMRPLWLLREMGVPFEFVPVIQAYRLADPSAPGAPFNTADPAFRALNTQGQVPILRDGTQVLTESMAITLHLARTRGGPLAPANAAEDGEALQWGFVAISALEAPSLDILMTCDAGRQDTPDGQTVLATASAALMRPLARIEQHLQGRDWLMGGRFTVADIMVEECLRYAQPHPPALAPFPMVRAWLERCQSRPIFRTLMQEREAETL